MSISDILEADLELRACATVRRGRTCERHVRAAGVRTLRPERPRASRLDAPDVARRLAGADHTAEWRCDLEILGQRKVFVAAQRHVANVPDMLHVADALGVGTERAAPDRLS